VSRDQCGVSAVSWARFGDDAAEVFDACRMVTEICRDDVASALEQQGVGRRVEEFDGRPELAPELGHELYEVQG
jgi:hypothetical protein